MDIRCGWCGNIMFSLMFSVSSSISFFLALPIIHQIIIIQNAFRFWFITYTLKLKLGQNDTVSFFSLSTHAR